MEKAFKHVGIYDFWCIFGTGTIIFTTFISIIIFNCNYVISLKEYLTQLHADWSLLVIFIYVIISYSIGLILHSISKAITDINLLSFDVDKSREYHEWQNNSKDIRRKFQKYRLRYIGENTRITETVSQKNFDKCYDFLKHYERTKRTDKYHSLFGMARGLFTGYGLMIFYTLYVFIKNFSLPNFFMILAFVILTILFFVRAKKYYYKWLECVFIEYQFYYNEIKETKKG